MIKTIKELYKNKVVENVSTYDYQKYYYFYDSSTSSFFGIEKSISDVEHKLLCLSYVEKKIYSSNDTEQKIFEYLYNNKSYPFNNRTRIVISSLVSSEISFIISNFYQEYYSIQLNDIIVFFCWKPLDALLNVFTDMTIDDLGRNISIHEGLYINSDVSGMDVLRYISIVKKYLNTHNTSYTDFTSLVHHLNNDESIMYLNILNKYLVKNLLDNQSIKDLISTYFKCDLNVSKTSKYIYTNRNSILNKFDLIQKETGLNLQKFSHASVLYYLMNMREDYEC